MNKEKVSRSPESSQGVSSPTLEVPIHGLRVYDAGELAKTAFPDPSPPTRLSRPRSLTTQSQPKCATQIAYFSVQWHDEGYPDELILLPLCSSCSEPIVDLSMGVAVSDFPVEQSFELAGEVVGRPLRKVPGKLYFFHKGLCDTVRGIYNIELDKIFKQDQRHDSQAQQGNDDE